MLAALLAPLLVGCGAAVKQLYIDYNTTAGPQLFRYAAVDRDFHTVIHGNPTGASKGAFDAAVLAALQGSTYGIETHFTTRPSDNVRVDYRVVLAFSGDPQALTYGTVCTDYPSATLAAAEPTVYLLAAFCFRDRPLVRTNMSIGPLDAPTDAKLDVAVVQTVRALFQRDPTLAGEGREIP